ncbi:MAG: hypothetical protein FJY65_12880, partial [Calditrichaeota bacterium]|nr:hypothetical protein [Calditrichota bacterium]
MGRCIYCGQPAGFLKIKHTDCYQKHRESERLHEQEELAKAQLKKTGRQQIRQNTLQHICGIDAFENLNLSITEIAQKSDLSDSDKREQLIKSWESAVDKFLEDGVLSESEEKRLIDFGEYFHLSRDELDRNEAHSKLVKSAVLRDILNGIIPKRMSFGGVLPVNLQKGEHLIWIFKDTQYLEDKTRRQFVGGSRGVSVRIMKGVYYRVGAFKGHYVEQTERVHIDTGNFYITNKHIYFTGNSKSFRIPYSKIVSFEPYSDAIGLIRDATTAKPQIFITGDGWFAYNMVTNLAQL